jgi:hypothetical protein
MPASKRHGPTRKAVGLALAALIVRHLLRRRWTPEDTH